MSGADDRPVLVVGAGPVGLVVALLLARRSVPVIVLERREAPHAAPRAVHLDDAAVRVLQAAGVADAFAAVSRPAAGLRLLDARLRPFAVFPRSAPGVHGWPESVLFDQPVLEELLRAEVARCPLVELRAGCEVEALEQGEGGVGATVRDVLTGRREVVRGSALLGCDGASSTVRTAIGAGWHELGASERWFVVDVRAGARLPTWGGVDQVCDPHRAATFMALTGDRYRWEFRMRPGETAPDLTARLDELTGRWRPPPLQVVRAAEYTFRSRIADRWRDRRVLVLGDAAHLTPPFIGQGLGAGLRDAHNLAWKLAAVRGGAGDDLLETYQRERAPHARAVIRGAGRIGRAMTGGQDLAAALRRPVVASLLRVPLVRARAARGLQDRLPVGALVERRHRRDLAGTPCPQPTCRFDGRPVRLDDVLGDGWALLHVGPAPQDRVVAPQDRVVAPQDRVVALQDRVVALQDRVVVPQDRVVALHDRAAAVGARTVRVDALRDGGALAAWLEGGRATAALLRPDRFVAATA